MITNKYISKQLELAASLMELHDANPFKTKSYNSAAQIIDNAVNVDLTSISETELQEIEGIGKKVAANILEIINSGTFAELAELVEKTPKGVINMLGISGIGPKKIKVLWKDLEITSLEQLLKACKDGEVSKQKGFGEKTQEKIKGIVEFTLSNEGKFLYAEIEEAGNTLFKELSKCFKNTKVEIGGQFRRKLEIVEKLEFFIESDFSKSNFETINKIEELTIEEHLSSPFIWRGTYNSVFVEIHFVSPNEFTHKLFMSSSSDEHLTHEFEGNSLLKISKSASSEKEIYEKAKLPFIEPIYREGRWELETTDFSNIIQFTDLKGCLHNHSVYSDGKNTIEEMAFQCKEMGYSYFGISDHSKSAFYANGLYPDKVLTQHKEIDELNAKYPDFKIFKSIESDILNDGNLDYDEETLKTFDFIVASIHSNLNMDEKKATQRLITAIENPYTTMLGHSTGRLLLRREGYPINHRKIIDACAENKVIIELNANPWRLDIDWRWIQYCMEKEIMISINPDAHVTTGIYDMYYGTLAAQKGGLTKEMCFNAKSTTEIDSYFKEIKKIKGI